MTDTSLNSGESKTWLLIFAAWVMSLLGLLGSLFFSEVMSYPPCKLCWYQRICLYPLVAVLATGFLTRDRRVTLYAWPFVIMGIVISFYHNLLYYGVISESLAPCTEGVSCTEAQWELGFLSIPLLSGLAFVVLAVLLKVFSHGQKGKPS